MKICDAGRLRVGRSSENLRRHVVLISTLVALVHLHGRGDGPLAGCHPARTLESTRLCAFENGLGPFPFAPVIGSAVRLRGPPPLAWRISVEVYSPSFGWGAWARSASTCVGTHLSYEGTRNGSDVDSSAYRLRLHGPPPLAWRRLRENSCDTGRLRVLVFPRECCNSLSRDTRPSARS